MNETSTQVPSAALERRPNIVQRVNRELVLLPLAPQDPRRLRQRRQPPRHLPELRRGLVHGEARPRSSEHPVSLAERILFRFAGPGWIP